MSFSKPALIPFPDMLINRSLRKLRVTLRGGKIGMAKEVFDGHQRNSGLQHMHRRSMSHGMRSVPLFQKHGRIAAFGFLEVAF